ncbi:MAG: TFIIB-type zinc ribbon-containing protein [Halodesulfurarchaeum sp.]
MEVRGDRECKNCGTRWSYYETGSPACPECGSLQSVGIGERRLHTDRPAELDLAAAIEALADDRHREAGEAAEETAREYVRRRGFVDAGDLRTLEETFLAAWEIRHVAQRLRLVTPSLIADDAIDLRYVRTLFEAAAAGDRPAAADVPETMAGPRGLAIADAVDSYHDAVKHWVEDTDADVSVGGLLGRLDSHVCRVNALDGAVEPREAEKLLDAARALGDYARTGSGRSAVERALESIE